MQQRRGTPLPPPTPTELAAVRALVDAYRDRRTSRGVVVLSVLLVLVVGAFTFTTVTDRNFGRWFPWQMLAGAAVATVNARDFTRHQRRARQAVAARLGEPTPGWAPVRRPVLSTFERWAFVGCLALGAALVGSAVLLADHGPWTPFVWVLGIGAVSGSLLASAGTVLRDPLVGSGEVVPAVDGAIRRRQLGGLAGAALPVVLAASAVAPVRLLPWTYAVLAVGGACLATAWFLRRDENLLRDPRLDDAPDPGQWLAGTAA